MDQFPNYAVITAVESAANTLTFKKLETGYDLLSKMAWVLHRVELFMSQNATFFNGTGDSLQIGLARTNTIASLLLSDPNLVALWQVRREDLGAAASGGWVVNPHIMDYSTLPGGGLLILPSPLYAAIVGTGLSAAATAIVKLFYTVRQLKDSEWIELVEAQRLLAS